MLNKVLTSFKCISSITLKSDYVLLVNEIWTNLVFFKEISSKFWNSLVKYTFIPREK